MRAQSNRRTGNHLGSQRQKPQEYASSIHARSGQVRRESGWYSALQVLAHLNTLLRAVHEQPDPRRASAKQVLDIRKEST
jgi:hypothetical protein